MLAKIRGVGERKSIRTDEKKRREGGSQLEENDTEIKAGRGHGPDRGMVGGKSSFRKKGGKGKRALLQVRHIGRITPQTKKKGGGISTKILVMMKRGGALSHVGRTPTTCRSVKSPAGGGSQQKKNKKKW